MSDLYRIEKTERPVTIHLIHQVIKQGVVFLSPLAYAHTGGQTILDLLREKARFLPFRDQDGQFCLLNKEAVSFLRYAHDGGDEEETAFGKPERVRIVFFSGDILEGEIRLDMPEGKNRLLDYINASPGFFALRTAEAWFIANGSKVREISPC